MQPLPPPVHLEAETKATLVPSSESCGNTSPTGFDVLVPFGFGVYTTVSRSRNSRIPCLSATNNFPQNGCSVPAWRNPVEKYKVDPSHVVERPIKDWPNPSTAIRSVAAITESIEREPVAGIYPFQRPTICHFNYTGSASGANIYVFSPSQQHCPF